MSKRIIALILFAALLVFTFVQTNYLSNTTVRLRAEIESIDKLMANGKKDDVRALATQFLVNWENELPTMESLISHQEIDALSFDITSCVTAAQNGNEYDYWLFSQLAKSRLFHIAEIDALSLENIF